MWHKSARQQKNNQDYHCVHKGRQRPFDNKRLPEDQKAQSRQIILSGSIVTPDIFVDDAAIQDLRSAVNNQ
ncbi:unnamed protein product, partial [marine sediment metagenome]